jgi:hypothetical protein
MSIGSRIDSSEDTEFEAFTEIIIWYYPASVPAYSSRGEGAVHVFNAGDVKDLSATVEHQLAAQDDIIIPPCL